MAGFEGREEVYSLALVVDSLALEEPTCQTLSHTMPKTFRKVFGRVDTIVYKVFCFGSRLDEMSWSKFNSS